MSTPNGEQCSGEHIRCENNFGSAIRYINSSISAMHSLKITLEV